MITVEPIATLEELTPASTGEQGPAWARRMFYVAAAIVVSYALLAGLRTVTDFDFFWQLATGRWVVVHRQIPTVDVFSYTAAGQPWIYPVGSAVLFFGVYLLGGYALLSWMGAAACCGTVALLLRRGTVMTAAVTLFAIPRIAQRTTPRADMFTAVLFAAFLTILWQQHVSKRAPLWLLPILMIAWVNLHLGFVAGIALLGAYVGIEFLDDPFRPNHLRRSFAEICKTGPWLLATVAATVINPWGWNIFVALVRQDKAMALHSAWISEWGRVPIGLQLIFSELSLRRAKGAFVILLGIAVIAVVTAVIQRRFGSALLIAGAMVLAVRHARFGTLFSCVVVIVGGAVLSIAAEKIGESIREVRMRRILLGGAVALIVLLSVVRSADLVSNARYFGETDPGNFGTGLGWWFPTRAMDFVQKNNLPGELFNTYTEGGYLVWKLGPKYRDYIDGRAIPFGPERFARVIELASWTSPDSREWAQEAEQYNINTIVVPVGRFDGLEAFPQLRAFCNNAAWAPVYLDETAAVFLRRTTQNQSLVERFGLQCSSVTLPVSVSTDRVTAFNQWSNAAGLLFVLGRYTESADAATKALSIYPDSAIVHFIRAKAVAALGEQRQAERDYVATVALEPNDVALIDLGGFYAQQGRVKEALDCLERAVQLSSKPYRPLLTLGYAYTNTGRPQDGLRAFTEAVAAAPERMPPEPAGKSFAFEIAQGRANAYYALGNIATATKYQEEAVKASPRTPEAWLRLADLLTQQNRVDDAARARERALEATQ